MRSTLTPGLRAAEIAARQRDAGREYDFDLEEERAVATLATPGLRAEVASGALAIEPAAAEPSWRLELRWSAIGRGDARIAVPRPGRPPSLRENEARYEREDGSEEWYLSGPLGIEQGFTIVEPPVELDRDDELVLALTVGGSLVPTRSGDEIVLRDATGAAIVHYGDLFASDVDGRPLETWLATKADTIEFHIADRNAHYPLAIDPLVGLEVAVLHASGLNTDEIFGRAVAIDGDTAVVGAPYENTGGDNAGAAYVFGRNQGGPDRWGEVRKLLASDGQAGDYFGTSVAVSGDTVIVGAPYEDAAGWGAGAAYLFSRNHEGPDSWGEVKKVLASDPQQQADFGSSVAIDGDTAIVGSSGEGSGGTSAGAAYVLGRDQGGPGNWGEVRKLLASDAQEYDGFGNSVAISGETVIVGASRWRRGSWPEGAAYVFSRNQGGPDNWGEVTRLLPGNAQGQAVFGGAVAIQGDTAIVGAEAEDTAGDNAGAAYVFGREQGGPENWGEVATLHAGDAQPSSYFGTSVALYGENAIVGASYENGRMVGTGAAYGFGRNQGAPDAWGQWSKLFAADGMIWERFGCSAALSGDTAIIGAEHQGPGDQGAAYVFALRKGNGDPCSADDECGSQHCIDAVCCDTDCGSGDPFDCQACSISAGAEQDGICGPSTGNGCDDGAFCNGTDHCSSGACSTHSGDPCPGPDGDDDCAESCDEEARACAADDPDGTACDTGTCQSGVCEAGEGGAGGMGGAETGGAGVGGSGASGASGGSPSTGPGNSTEMSDEAGCGCRVAGPRRVAPFWGVALVAALVLVSRARRGDERTLSPESRGCSAEQRAREVAAH